MVALKTWSRMFLDFATCCEHLVISWRPALDNSFPLISQSHDLSDEIAAVVIGRNEGKRLIGCLQSIGPDGISIVYVDSGSTDGSAEVADRLGAFVVRLGFGQSFTAARARNEGFAASIGQFRKSFAPTRDFPEHSQFAIVHCEMSVKGRFLWDFVVRTFDFCCLQSA